MVRLVVFSIQVLLGYLFVDVAPSLCKDEVRGAAA